MKFRDISIFTGERFAVPRNIQRIDTKSTHGWQVRYQGTKMFSDHSADGSGAGPALVLAAMELVKRIARLPVPPTLRKQASANKTSTLPRGISGPVVRSRTGSSVRNCHFCVLLPRFGHAPGCSTVYIGSETTYTAKKYKHALGKAIALRQAAEQAYELAAARHKRKAAAAMKAVLVQSASSQ